MSTYTIEGCRPLSGVIRVPPSKSHSMRAILLGSLCSGKSQIRSLLHSPDTQAMMSACSAMGAQIETHGAGSISVEGVAGEPQTPADVVNAGNSGQVLRFIGAVAGLATGYTVITGDESIRKLRPVQPLIDALTELGALAVSSKENGHAPIIVKGAMAPGVATLSVQDSQPLSGLLMAAAFLEGKSEFILQDVGEKPWIELTLGWLDSIGAKVENFDFERIVVHGKRNYPGFNYTVPADLSSALYPIAAAICTKSEITLSNIQLDPAQGDRLAIEALRKMGAHIEIDEEMRSLTVKQGPSLKGCELDVNPFIDAVTILPVIACFSEGETRLVNAAIARKKECDRLSAMTRELKKMGAQIEELDDGLVIQPSELKAAEMVGYEDHRVVMSLSVAALAAKGTSKIAGAEVVKKSYADFFSHLRFLGGNVHLDV